MAIKIPISRLLDQVSGQKKIDLLSNYFDFDISNDNLYSAGEVEYGIHGIEDMGDERFASIYHIQRHIAKGELKEYLAQFKGTEKISELSHLIRSKYTFPTIKVKYKNQNFEIQKYPYSVILKFFLESNTASGRLKTQVWNIFDILRKESFGLNESNVILLLLSLYKDDLLSKGFILNQKVEIEEFIDESLKGAETKLIKEYEPIINSFSSALLQFSKSGFEEVIGSIFQINKEDLKENFEDIFDTILYQISDSQGKRGGEFIQPVELTLFMCSIADLPSTSKIFNPFAGVASFGVFFDQEHSYFGQELLLRSWAIGKLRLMAHNLQTPADQFVCEDSLANWPNQDNKFDLVIANPPFNLRLPDYLKELEPNIRSIEQFVIEKGINSLNSNGKLITLLPVGFLFKGGREKALREKLIEEDLIDSVISFPGGLLQHTGIPFVILVIDKAKKSKGQVRFIDAKNSIYSRNTRDKFLNDYELNRIFNDRKQDSNAVRIVKNREIVEADYNLNVPRYFQKEIEGVKLRTVLDHIKGAKADFTDNAKIVGIKDLKDDKLDSSLNLENIKDVEFGNLNARKISETCLLLAGRWKTLKPTLFIFKGESIILRPDILPFHVKEDLIDLDYLINELHSGYVEEQLDSFRVGSAVPMLRKEDLLDVVIKLPSLIEQKAKMQGIVELSAKMQILQEERNALAHGKATKDFNEFASLKHTLGRPRQNILDWTDNLLHFMSLKNEGFDSLNNSFKEFYEIDIVSALKEIKHDINFMSDVLEKGENGLVLKEFDIKIIPFTEMNKLINELSNNGLNFKIDKLLLKGEKLKERGIEGNATLFKTLFDNILTNAKKYGFDKNQSTNEVVFELIDLEDVLQLEVRNNGKPFPKNFDREKFITKYSTANKDAGSGLGGYDINRIATAFNNPEWELILDQDPIYKVKFQFQFPIKLIS
jgi:type I restriction enzyme M protein